MDVQLTLELIDEDFPDAERQAESLSLTLRRGEGDRAADLYVPYAAPDGEDYLLRLRCDGYDSVAPSFQWVNPADVSQMGAGWWPRFAGTGGLPRGDHQEVVFCTPGVREYHEHPSHRAESHPKTAWKLARVVVLAWMYLNKYGAYAGRGGV